MVAIQNAMAQVQRPCGDGRVQPRKRKQSPSPSPPSDDNSGRRRALRQSSVRAPCMHASTETARLRSACMPCFLFRFGLCPIAPRVRTQLRAAELVPIVVAHRRLQRPPRLARRLGAPPLHACMHGQSMPCAPHACPASSKVSCCAPLAAPSSRHSAACCSSLPGTGKKEVEPCADQQMLRVLQAACVIAGTRSNNRPSQLLGNRVIDYFPNPGNTSASV